LHWIISSSSGVALLFTISMLSSAAHASEKTDQEDKKIENPLSFIVKNIDGEEVDLSEYQGKVVMIVNVASKCGLTPQYEELQALYDRYKEKGFVILGFPANNFMGQEPGSNEEIKFFCETEYNVTFDMFSKISVKGDDIAPLYAYLTEEETNEEFAGEIEWNFAKFLLDRQGNVIARFNSRTKPKDAEVVRAIETALLDEVEDTA
jgi:glutathione peroxidase-family protein